MPTLPNKHPELLAICNLQDASRFCYAVARSRVELNLNQAATIAQVRGSQLHAQAVARLEAFYAAQAQVKISEIGL